MCPIKAGWINGSPLYGLNYRECIEVTKVLDGCMSRFGDLQFTLTIPDVGGVPPYTFMGLNSSGATTISNLLVTPIDGSVDSRVSFDATIPVTVSFTDATQTLFTAPSTITLHREVILRLPDASIMPYQIAVTSSAVSTLGTFNSPTELNCRVCILQISKVTILVDMIVPSYGYCRFPECEDDDACAALFNLPLFPPLI